MLRVEYGVNLLPGRWKMLGNEKCLKNGHGRSRSKIPTKLIRRQKTRRILNRVRQPGIRYNVQYMLRRMTSGIDMEWYELQMCMCAFSYEYYDDRSAFIMVSFHFPFR